ncbi:MAG TPA: hypothetical protein VD860_01850 [Azospirillum sp.]|nr:hypothetical protein [Azospirillum sp.]
MADLTFPTMRGPMSTDGLPAGLILALRKYDDMRAEGNYEAADRAARLPASVIGEHLARLMRGMKRITYRGMLAIASKHSGVCPVYVRQKTDVLGTLMGLFYWNDGKGETRRRLLLLAWRKGASPTTQAAE